MPLALLIAGGGTGGHLFPGIAVAREVLTRAADSSITFVGTAAGIEARVVPHEGFQLELIRSAGLKGKSLTALARGISLLPLSAVDRVGRLVQGQTIGRDRGWWLQFGPGRRVGGSAGYSDAAHGTERRAGPHEQMAGAVRQRRRGEL